MKHPAAYIADYYRRHKILTTDAVSCMEYTLQSLLNELSKVLAYYVVFLTLGLHVTFLWCYFTYVSIRLFSGGIHCKTYWQCFFVSFIFLGFCVWGKFLFHSSSTTLLILAVVSCGLPLAFSPVTPSFRMIKGVKHRWIMKVVAVGVSVVWILFSISYSKYSDISISILLTVSVSNYQLIIPKVVCPLWRVITKKR